MKAADICTLKPDQDTPGISRARLIQVCDYRSTGAVVEADQDLLAVGTPKAVVAVIFQLRDGLTPPALHEDPRRWMAAVWRGLTHGYPPSGGAFLGY
jgi:hypothetical protein